MVDTRENKDTEVECNKGKGSVRRGGKVKG